MIPFDQADVLDLRSDFDDEGAAFDLEVFNHGDRVSVLQNIAVGVLDDLGLLTRLRLRPGAPFVSAFRTDPDSSILVGVFGFPFWSVR